MQDNNTPIVVKIAPATLIIFSILFSPVLIAGLTLLWKGGQLRDGFLLCCLFGLAVYGICSPNVELLPGKLIYRALFKKKSVNLAQVRYVAIASRPAPTLELSGTSKNPPLISFIVKPFSKVGVAAILHHIQTESPAAQFDAVSADMKAGDFESVTRQTLAFRNILRIVSTVAGSAFGVIVGRILFHHQ